MGAGREWPVGGGGHVSSVVACGINRYAGFAYVACGLGVEGLLPIEVAFACVLRQLSVLESFCSRVCWRLATAALPDC